MVPVVSVVSLLSFRCFGGFVSVFRVLVHALKERVLKFSNIRSEFLEFGVRF